MKSFLQGKWLGHPLHAALVNLPVGLWPAALVFDVFSHFAGSDSRVMAVVSFYAIAVGLAGAVASVAPGLADWLEVKPEKPAWKLGLWHLILNVATTTVWAINLGVRWSGGWETAPVPPLPLALSVVGAIMTLVATYIGGRMVYEYGVSVARHSKDYWRRIAEKGSARLPEKD